MCGRFLVFSDGWCVVDSWFSVMGGVWLILGFRQWIVGSRLWAADFGYWVPILAVDGWLFLIIGFGFVCGYACGWDMILFSGVGCRHGCVGARIRGLMVAVGFALDVAALALGVEARERSERRREIEKRPSNSLTELRISTKMANEEDSAQEEQEQQNEQDPDADKISSSSDFDYDSDKNSDDDSSYYSDESLTYLVCLTIDPD
uniref:Uncharacterized protein n=1 Tax=Fagus sylvatica TaxID=28930 RepID=A0A2N9H3Z6_FAGSY